MKNPNKKWVFFFYKQDWRRKKEKKLEPSQKINSFFVEFLEKKEKEKTDRDL